jgi:uncharacterized GH25 family protein
MKKRIALLTALAVLAAPISASAHRAWLVPTSTVLSGADAWVGFDAGMSNGVFIADHAAMRLDGLTITAPDGSTVAPENLMRGHYRSTCDAHLTQQGTYRVANVMTGVVVSYKVDGQTIRWRGAQAEMAANIPAGAADVTATRSDSRVETYVTLGAPTETVFEASGKGLELQPVTHPNDLVAGEAATFKLLRDGQPAADMDVTIARGGSRYRNAIDDVTVHTDADGGFSYTWPEAGMYWINASIRTPAQGDQLASSAQYNGVVEVLP